MVYLIIVSLVWAFSFGLIKGTLTGINPNVVALMRMLFSFVVFGPFIKRQGISYSVQARFIIIGTVQFGLMYITYISSYQYLQAYEVALFTIFTPFYVTLIGDFFKRSFAPFNLLSASLAVLGTGIIIYNGLTTPNFILGFLLVQVSNICFALGQIWYRRLMKDFSDLKDHHVFGLLYLGALIITGITASYSTSFQFPNITIRQLLVLMYLGFIASGFCFFLWNVGARKSSIGNLAVMNNIKIPLAVGVSLLFFGESADLNSLLFGGGMIVAALSISGLKSNNND